MTQLECDQGLGPPFTTIEFSYYNLLNPAYTYISYIAWERISRKRLRIPRPIYTNHNELILFRYISRFCDPVIIKPGPLSDVTYACWGLAKPSDRLDWYLDSSDWKW
ncbi:hypothetical protein N7491_011283 [Penicillium cf. griseofulvum]|nr:hypothetical protein N7491_011283 [Penicillium cf. griseofulvum]KAJ5442283.1 hypothetical protein N7445_005290 [Penicillium cf. griseofulvum]